ncbi:MAG: preprotein translocase subunit SecY [Planctomycetota bacterium]|nr:preprotein translocase subunit SecY [Planctomycetota bacterium]
MLQAFLNIFRVADLRNRVFFTLGMLVIYRIGFWIPLVGVDQVALSDAAQRAAEDSSGFGRILQFASVFSGGALGQSTIFGLGIMPYITASIIFQLLQSVWQPLQELKKEGVSGQQRIMEWTRYVTVLLCIVQGLMWLGYMYSQNLVQPAYMQGAGRMVFYISGLTALTAGSMFLMWLGEQIDKHGIGNGVSIILTAGILSRMPGAVEWIIANFDPSIQSGDGKVGVIGVLLLLAGFVVVVGGAVLITVAQRRIPIQQAKHIRGRKMYGGQRHFLPLRLNHSGVMPIIFASSLMVFPSTLFGWLASKASAEGWSQWLVEITAFFAQNFQMGAYPFVIVEIVMIYFFAYFWVTVQLSPGDMAKELKKHSSFIPGLRPGPRTAEYLEMVIERMTYVGAGFLCIIAIIPTFVSQYFGVPMYVSQFLGGTGLLIVVSVMLDLVQRIEANLLMRNYAGFLSSGNEDGPRLRSARG